MWKNGFLCFTFQNRPKPLKVYKEVNKSEPYPLFLYDGETYLNTILCTSVNVLWP